MTADERGDCYLLEFSVQELALRDEAVAGKHQQQQQGDRQQQRVAVLE